MSDRATIYVCSACGKTSSARWELGGGWDESCATHGILVYEDSIVRRPDGRVFAADAVQEGHEVK